VGKKQFDGSYCQEKKKVLHADVKQTRKGRGNDNHPRLWVENEPNSPGGEKKRRKKKIQLDVHTRLGGGRIFVTKKKWA